MISELIARLEGASEGSEALDREIHLLVHGAWLAEQGCRDDGEGGWVHPKWGKIAPPHPYTTSLDAAMLLVPSAWVFPQNNGLHQEIDNGRWFWGCALSQIGINKGWVALDWRKTQPPTAPLAVCIIAMKARAYHD